MISDHVPEDAQRISDPEWIEYGLARGWGLLTQDLRISTQPAVHALLRQHHGCVHCLDSAELSIQLKAERIDSRRGPIYQAVLDRRVGFFVLRESGPPRRKR